MVGLPADLRDLLQYTWESPHFQFYYTYISNDAAQTDKRYDAIKPCSDRHGVASFDYIEQCATFFETAWEYYFKGPVSYPLPPGLENDQRYPVYLYDVSLGDVRQYGLTYKQRLLPNGRWESLIAIRNNYDCFPKNHDPNPAEGALKVSIAHELFHAIQYGLPTPPRHAISLNPDPWSWWSETTATFMEDAVFDEVDDYLNYLRAWFQAPDRSLDLFDGQHEYGSVVLAKYLTEKHGGPSIIRQIWDEYSAGAPDALNAIDAVLNRDELYLAHSRKAEVFATGFVIANLLHDDPTLGYEEGSSYPDVRFHKEHVDSTSVPQTIRLAPLSAAYIAILPKSPFTRLSLSVQVELAQSSLPPIRAAAVGIRPGAPPELRPMYLRRKPQTNTYAGRLELTDLTHDSTPAKVVLVLANVTWGSSASHNLAVVYEV